MQPSGAPDRSKENGPEHIRVRASARRFPVDRLHHSLPHQSQDLLCTHDLSGRILSIHSPQPQVLGYTVEELLQIRLPGLLAPEYRPRLDDYLRIIQQHQTASGLTTLLTKSGKRTICEYHSLLQRGGAAPVVFAIVRDVTETRRTERKLRRSADLNRTQEALRASEERYRRVIELAGEGIWMYDAQARVTWVNPQMAQMLGYTVDEILGRPALDFIAPESVDLVRAKIQRRMQGISDHYEVKFRHQDGSGIWGLVNATSLRDVEGKVVGGVGMVSNIAERKRAEEELFNSRQLLQSVLDNIPQRVFWKDRNLKFVACNRPFALDSGYLSSDDVLGKTDYEMSWAANADLYRADDLDVMQSGKPKIRYEEPQNKPDGTQSWLVTSKLPMVDLNGQVIGVLGTYEDISDRKRAEEALRRSEAGLREFERVVENLDEMIVVVDHEYRHVIANPVFLKYWGKTKEQVIGHSVAEVTGQEFFATVAKIVLDECFQGKLIHRERSQPFPGMGERELAITYLPVEGPGGIDRVACIFHDITDRKRAEEALRRSETQLRSFVENAPYAITRASIQGNRFLDANPAAIRILGYDSKAEVLALKLSDVYVDPHGREEFLSRLMASSEPIDVELRWRRKNGSPLTIRGSTWITHDTLNGEEVVEGIFDDVTERRLLEEQFLQAQKMEAVGRLAGGVAHDFNNLLEVILGYADMLTEVEKDPARQRKLEAITSAAHRAASLTGQLLAFSRKQVLEFKLLSLNSVVSDTDRMLRRLIGEDIRLRLHLQSNLALAKADPAQIEQVIMNLAVNARDAMPNGGELLIETANVTVDESTASPGNIPPPGSYVMLAASDTGLGMDSETQAHIFDPFFTTKPAGKGTGLGLATVYGIVKQSGGCIRVVSEVGRGARFEIFLPQVEGTADSLKPPKRTTEVRGGNETILLAEDSAALRAFLCENLQKLGYKVLPARDGPEALHLAEHEPIPIHLLITDVVMPGMSGPDLVSQMKSLRPEIKVLLMSGYPEDQAGRNPDFDPQSFLQKPFEMADLSQKIRTALSSNAKKHR
ncbi:MAG: PAS domain S-box protein [Terracidiphilus sp.]